MESGKTTALEWEELWAPYDEGTYAAAQAAVEPGAIVLDIGAGDLRLARRLATKARWVYAVEQDAERLATAGPVPANVTVLWADARTLVFPPEITTAVLLMRHCRHFALYWRKLAATSCRQLITNARWGMDVEVIDTRAARRPYASLNIGWYACACGGVGFLPGDAEHLTVDLLTHHHEVTDCPHCPPAG